MSKYRLNTYISGLQQGKGKPETEMNSFFFLLKIRENNVTTYIAYWEFLPSRNENA